MPGKDITLGPLATVLGEAQSALRFLATSPDMQPSLAFSTPPRTHPSLLLFFLQSRLDPATRHSDRFMFH